MAFGEANGNVKGWLDDVLIVDEVDDTYKDEGVDIETLILSRAYTLDDPFCPKTGMNAEFEFQDSSAVVEIQAILDMVPDSDLVATSFDSGSSAGLVLPFTIPATLPGRTSLLRTSHDLQRYGQWRELQFFIGSSAGKLQMRSIRLTGFIDSLVLQTSI